MTIDWWTLGIQTVNIVILVWLLGRFFWRPVAAMIEQRQAVAKRTLADAEARNAEAVAALAEIERTRDGFSKEREVLLAAAADQAERVRKMRLDDTAKDAADLITAARAQIEKDRTVADQVWLDRAGRLAVDIAGRLVARLDGPAVRDNFLDCLIGEIERLSEPARQAMAVDNVRFEAVSAAALPPAEQERYRARIGKAFGGSPQIAFTADPSLISGLELRGPHFVVSNSWRADLSQILADLTHDH